MKTLHISTIKRALGLATFCSLGLLAAQTQAATCTYSVSNEWSSGFQGAVTITNNTSAAINGWTVGWSYSNNKITSSWNATLTGSNPYSATALNWNSSIQPGQSVSFGFQGDKNGSAAEKPVITGAICSSTTSSAATTSSSSKSSVASSVASSATSSVASSISTSGQQCNWYGTLYPLCTTITSGWGYENNKSCIAAATCSAQPSPYGITSASSSVASSIKSSSSSSSFSSMQSSITGSSSSAATTNCTTTTADPDGDGFGIENNKTCIVVNHTAMQITGEMGLGWNLGNTLDAYGNAANPMADESYWGNPKTTKAMIDTVKAAGFNTLRVPVSWDDHVSGSGYTINSEWMDRVEEVVNYGIADNMYVILNVHHNNGWEAPTYANEANAKDRLTKLWQQISTRFSKYGDKIIFETMNEPLSGSDWWGTQEFFDVVNDLNAAAVSTIRATGGNNAKRLIMIPGYTAGSNDFQLSAIEIPSDNKLAISVHAYLPYYFAFSFPAGSTDSTSVFSPADLDDLFSRLNSRFVSNDVPVVIGEWASTNKDNLSEREKHAQYYAAKAKALNIPIIWWDNNNAIANSADAMGLLNRTNNTWYFPTIVTALQNGYK